MELHKITAAAAAEAVRCKEITARELTEIFLSRCAAVNVQLNSFIHIFEEDALRQADAVDERVRRNEGPLPLAGVPAAVKDDLCYQDAPLSCGAAALKDFRPPYTAAAVQKLVEAGAVILGKTNLDQFGLGSSTASSYAGPSANPWDLNKAAGDGAAAAVAAGQCLLALSSDSGGALRIGASHCGVTGLLPTTGLISRHGLNTFAPSFARVGVVARNAADAALALKAVAGWDPRDAATASVKDGVFAGTAEVPLKTLKIGFPAAVFGLAGEQTRNVLDEATARLKSAGAEVVDISLPLFREALQAYYVIAAAEASSNLGRFDGIRFGAPGEGASLEEMYGRARAAAFGAEARRRSVFGAHLLSKDSFERYYRQAQKVWALVRQGFFAALESCDLIALPAAANPGGAAHNGNFLERYAEDLFCAPVSLAGLPALCIPAGTAGGLPVGLQLTGKPFAEEALILPAGPATDPFRLSPAGVLSGREDRHGI